MLLRMKKIYTIFLSALLLVSCSSVELSPTDRYDKSYAFNSMENAELYLNYFYNKVPLHNNLYQQYNMENKANMSQD